MKTVFYKGMSIIYVDSGETLTGVIEDITDNEDYPVMTNFDEFTVNGYCHIDSKYVGCFIVPAFIYETKPKIGDYYYLYNYFNTTELCIVRSYNPKDLTLILETYSGLIAEIDCNKHNLTDFCEYEYIPDTPVTYMVVPTTDTFKTKVAEKPKTTLKKGNNTMKSLATTTLDANKHSAIVAAKLTLGKTAIKSAQKMIAPKLPMFVKGYAEHPLFGIVIANAFNTLIQTKFSDNEKATMVAEAMMDASMLLATEHFDIEGMLTGFLDDIKLPSVSKK